MSARGLLQMILLVVLLPWLIAMAQADLDACADIDMTCVSTCTVSLDFCDRLLLQLTV